MEELKKKLDNAYVMIQDLDLKPTLKNIETIRYVMDALKGAYNALEEQEKQEAE